MLYDISRLRFFFLRFLTHIDISALPLFFLPFLIFSCGRHCLRFPYFPLPIPSAAHFVHVVRSLVAGAKKERGEVLRSIGRSKGGTTIRRGV